MSYYKFTIACGRDSAGEIVTLNRNGDWQAATITRAARKAGFVGPFEFTHHVGDLSGRGRGGHDGRYQVNAGDQLSKAAAWSEFGR